ncbi:MAG: thioredoxin domain-containing protein [Hyphomonadaceae bacterium]
MKLRAIVAVLGLALAACEEARAPEPYETVAISPFLGDAVLGNPDAPVALVEYASTTCGHCLAFHQQVFPDLKAKYIDTGKVKLRFVMMPTQPVAIAMAGEALARCAGEDKYFDVIATLFDAQRTLISAARNPWQLQQELRGVGKMHGLDNDEVGSCIDDEAILAHTRAGAQAAPAEITGTPSFAIDGRKLELETLEDLSAQLDAALAKAASPPSGDGH